MLSNKLNVRKIFDYKFQQLKMRVTFSLPTYKCWVHLRGKTAKIAFNILATYHNYKNDFYIQPFLRVSSSYYIHSVGHKAQNFYFSRHLAEFDCNCQNDMANIRNFWTGPCVTNTFAMRPNKPQDSARRLMPPLTESMDHLLL